MSDNHKLRTVVVRGEIRSVNGLDNLITQFESVAHDCDSSAHEVASIAMQWAANRIRFLECQLDEIRRAIEC